MKHRKVAILCNGPTLADNDLSKIDCETIGLNASWRLTRSTWHVMTDSYQWEVYRKDTGDAELEGLRTLVTADNGPGHVKVKIRRTHQPKWSIDPMEYGLYLCGTVTYLALQLAVAWGYSEIVMVGLDLAPDAKGRGKFYGGQWAPQIEPRQREVLGYAWGVLSERYQIPVWNVNERSRCGAFAYRSFRECFGGD